MDGTPEEQVTALYEEHASAVLAFVLRYDQDRQHAEDVVQETLLRAWRSLADIDSRAGNPRAYLLTVVATS